MKIIVGLGNPGEKYCKTRHNAGFMFIDELAKRFDIKLTEEKKLNAFVGKSPDFILVKPMTFMNESGKAVSNVMLYYKLLPKYFGILKKADTNLEEVLIVAHDDLDIKSGEYKVSVDSRAAGHNGVQSIIDNLKTKNFKRIRLGIKPSEDVRVNVKNYVLNKFSPNEIIQINGIIKEIVSLKLSNIF
ncbi:aminoacyl-tRNA hydrolase [Patescibacteria group bacterium]|nr:aminoacyl-tRNA hydrolase [Patescibacteria group bacterium]